jgi:anti-anti-sigma factor
LEEGVLVADGIKIDREDRGDLSVVRVQGYIDSTTAQTLENSLQDLLKADRWRLVVDLAGVDYISSAGWGVFISRIKDIRDHGGDLKLTGMGSDVSEVFDLLEFNNILQAFHTVDEGAEAFKKKS